MKTAKILILCFGMFAVLYSCTKTENTITPVQFPKDLSINGFNFPEDSTTIYKWLENQDTTKIVSHAWGIWAGLTEPTKQNYNGQNLLVFETWMGVQELAAMSAQGIVDKDDETRNQRTSLSVPKQFLHGHLLTNGSKPIDTNFVVLETVSYDPSAANFVTSNQLFNKSKLMSYSVKDGIGKVPEFPNTAITTKPTYYAGVPDKNGLIRVPVWESPNPAKAYRYTQWQKWVYADINNKQKPNKTLVLYS